MHSAPDHPAVVLHIGLHKTGTRFLQRQVFAMLNSAEFNYNPPAVWKPLREATRWPDDPRRVAAARAAVQEWRKSGDPRTLIISEPHISGDMYSSHQDYRQNLALMRELFPEAAVIFFIRRQSDWLQSAYRQHLAKGKPIPIEVFLNWYNGGFRPRIAREVHGARNVEPLTLRFLAIFQDYLEAYGEGRVHLLRQEDLRTRPEDVKTRLAAILGLEALPPEPPTPGQNRSYSALAIHLFHPTVLRHYPPPGPKDVGGPRHSLLRRLTKPFRRLRRVVIQHGFDRLVYRDWDLLGRHGMRSVIEDHYAEENRELERIANAQLDASAAPNQSHDTPSQD